ncbi:MAG: DUF1232 domain-containing protein [Cyclobacteriaceae bacterium]|nr:DUF1232 domain-containing protein [Cyclobacteriaceae bacterium]
MTDLLKNRYFQNALRNAIGLANNPHKIADLLDNASHKLSDMDGNKQRISDFFYKVKTLMRMLRAYIRGEYRLIPWKSLLMIIASLLYFVMPLDFIPDFIPMAGLADDVSIILLVFNSINSDINDFLAYEESLIEEDPDNDEFA